MKLSEILGDDVTVSLRKGAASPVALNRAVRRVLDRFPEVDTSDLDPDIEHLLERLDACRRSGDWIGIKWRHVASGARAAFVPPHALDTRWDGLRVFLLDVLNGDHKRSFARACFSAYLQGYSPDTDLTRFLARSLKKSWSGTLPQIKPLVDMFSIFDIRGLDRRVAEFMMHQDNPYDALKHHGFASPHMSGLLQLTHRQFIAMQKEAVASQDDSAVQRVLNWLHPSRNTVLGEGQAIAIDALLLPWVNDTPVRAIQERIRSELVEAYGDPRIQNSRWRRVDNDALSVIRRWLTGASLNQFLDIVTAVEGSHMWAPRREFWENMHALGLIDEAWVILNRQGADRARTLADETRDSGYLSHGKAFGSDSISRCYLMLRCGKGIVVEGSQNFSIRFYGPDNERCPKLYEDKYYEHNFYRQFADRWIPHNGPWQDKTQNSILRIRGG